MTDGAESLVSETERWCAGLRLASTRTLEPHERKAIARRAADLSRGRRLVLGICAVLAILPIAFVITGGLALELGFWPAVFAGWVFGVPLLALVARDVSRSRRAHLADLTAGRVLVFRDRAGGAAAAVVTDPRSEPTAGASRRLDVFSGSHTVLGKDDQGRPAFHRVRVRDVAHGPTYAMRVPLAPMAAGDDGQPPPITFLKRTLTDSERAEVLVYVRRFERPSAAIVIGLAMFAITTTGLAGVLRGQPWDRDALGGVAGLLVGGLAVWRYSQNFRVARGLRRDVATGWALTPSVNSAPQADDPAPDAPPAESEFLPHSLLVWTVTGNPATWRDLSEDVQTSARRAA